RPPWPAAGRTGTHTSARAPAHRPARAATRAPHGPRLATEARPPILTPRVGGPAADATQVDGWGVAERNRLLCLTACMEVPGATNVVGDPPKDRLTGPSGGDANPPPPLTD